MSSGGAKPGPRGVEQLSLRTFRPLDLAPPDMSALPAKPSTRVGVDFWTILADISRSYWTLRVRTMAHHAHLIGYARTSTTDQQAGLDAQLRDLKAARCRKVFSEQASAVGN